MNMTLKGPEFNNIKVNWLTYFDDNFRPR